MKNNIKTTATLLSLAFLMGTALNFSVVADAPSTDAPDPSNEKAQPILQDVLYGGYGVHTPGTVVLKPRPMLQTTPHAVVGGYGAIPLKNLDREGLEARKNSMGTTCMPGWC